MHAVSTRKCIDMNWAYQVTRSIHLLQVTVGSYYSVRESTLVERSNRCGCPTVGTQPQTAKNNGQLQIFARRSVSLIVMVLF